MRRAVCWWYALVGLALICNCKGDERSAQTESQTPALTEAQKQRNELREQLTGTWARRIRTADSLWEGLRIDSDGRFGLLGIHTIHGLYWLVRADTIVLTTSNERYPQPIEARLATHFPSADSLVLSGDTPYLPGVYERADGMGWRITGAANFKADTKLGTESALYLELRGVNGDPGGKFLASQVLAVDRNRPPVLYHIYYAESDAKGLTEGHLYVTLVVEGVPTLELDSAVTVRLGDDVEDLGLWLGGPEFDGDADSISDSVDDSVGDGVGD